MSHFVFIALWILLVAPGTDTRFGSWPQFRGPTGQGVYVGAPLPVEWGPAKNIAWRQSIAGKGWSSPVLFQNRLYLTTAVPQSSGESSFQSLRVLCLDAESGSTIWDKEAIRQDKKAPAIHTKNSHASATPLVDGQRVYAHFGHEGIVCLSLDGNILWSNRDLAYKPVHGNGGSPLLAEGKIIFSCDGADQQFVVALDSSTGKVIWKTPRRTSSAQRFSFHTPLVISVNNGQQVISAGSGVIAGYDLQTGNEIWRVRHDGYSVVPRPVYGKGLVFQSTGYNTPELLAIRPDGQGDVTDSHIAWKTRRGAPLSASPLLLGDELYFISDSGTASCVDAGTGKVHWQERLGGAYSASPIAAAGRIYFLAEDGQTVVVAASKEYKLLARNKLGSHALASPAAADGALYIRTDKELYRIQSSETSARDR